MKLAHGADDDTSWPESERGAQFGLVQSVGVEGHSAGMDADRDR